MKETAMKTETIVGTVMTCVMLAMFCLCLCASSPAPTKADMKNVPTIKAALWLKVNDNPKTALEGPAFDRNGDLYFVDVEGGGKVFKIRMSDKTISTIYDDPKHTGFASVKIHKDGRLFLCGFQGGDIVVIRSDGKLLDVITTVYQGRRLIPDDMIFDRDGNIYFSSYEGDIKNPRGGIYRMDAKTSAITLLSNRVGNANGVSLSPDGKTLWVAETLATQTLQKFDLEKGEKADGQLIPSVVYRFFPHQGWPDSNTVDAEGNIYQAMAEAGRVVVLSPQGIGLAKIVIPSEYGGGYNRTYNVAFQPGTNIAYITASGKNGGAIFTFKAPVCGWPLFSHEQDGEKAKGCIFSDPK